jgi:hypothetical protein
MPWQLDLLRLLLFGLLFLFGFLLEFLALFALQLHLVGLLKGLDLVRSNDISIDLIPILLLQEAMRLLT